MLRLLGCLRTYLVSPRGAAGRFLSSVNTLRCACGETKSVSRAILSQDVFDDKWNRRSTQDSPYSRTLVARNNNLSTFIARRDGIIPVSVEPFSLDVNGAEFFVRYLDATFID